MNTERLEPVLASLGLHQLEQVYWNLTTAQLYEMAIRRREGHVAHRGALVTRTGSFTGRAPNDKFIVDEPSSRDKVWWGKVNRPFTEAAFERLYQRACRFLEGKEVFVQDLLAGADPSYELPIRVITQDAWHALFARNMFIRPSNFGRTLAPDEPQFTVLHVPHLHAMPSQDETHSEAFILVHLGRRLVLIGGTHYAGEIKKSIFSVMNYLLPQRGVLSMHSSANIGETGDVAVLFGLSGTGKTTLSADPKRRLIGDDEHAWGDHGVFNLEGGCYAKVINLDPAKEPLIHAVTQRFGTVLENVGMDHQSRRLDLYDASLTENTRAAYPITHIPGALYPGIAGHPKTIVMLTADAFGVLPPIARLTVEQAEYHFISGYTAKVAGTEKGVTEPTATFSTCFGAPFMSLHPGIYADLLGARMRANGVTCWLVNTGWTGGPYGVGHRMDIDYTRTMLNAALDGQLDQVPMRVDPHFGFEVPTVCPGIPDQVLDPSTTWPDSAAYAKKASELVAAFHRNFVQFTDHVSPEVLAAAPPVGAGD